MGPGDDCSRHSKKILIYSLASTETKVKTSSFQENMKLRKSKTIGEADKKDDDSTVEHRIAAPSVETPARQTTLPRNVPTFTMTPTIATTSQVKHVQPHETMLPKTSTWCMVNVLLFVYAAIIVSMFVGVSYGISKDCNEATTFCRVMQYIVHNATRTQSIM
jgi:hypothetical protein